MALHMAPPGFFPPPGFADHRPGNPLLNTFGEPSQSRLVKEIGKAAPRRKNLSNRDFAELKLKDPSSQFKILSMVGKTELHPSNEYALAIPLSLTEYSGSSDPSFRLKSAFVGQRILAGLGMNTENSNALSYHGALGGLNPGSILENETEASSNWGYLRNPSDTSKSSEIKKYFIELELMQTK
jgi:hypothetical protein